ncbi:PhoH family protein [Treponema phagedenis]|uniref:PhoH family protein n=1 Tax=Treponema phagedenis TaxID=162 RepID=UPI0002F22F12|nr:PhoH family protein [Treponema phagedenis]TYT79095.1 PhoH family protein [Treponema phagedenis]
MNTAYTIVLGNQELMASLCGVNDANVSLFEEYLGAPVVVRGNELSVLSNDEAVCRKFQTLVDTVLHYPRLNEDNSFEAVQSAVAVIEDSEVFNGAPACIYIPRGIRSVYPKTKKQVAFIGSIQKNSITFGLGPAGTGKTYIAVAAALQMLLSGRFKKLILTRPVVEAGENLGFLPGDLVQKINPYLRPLFDIMETLLPADLLRSMEESNTVEVAPLAYMRGRTLHSAVVILDEAQNTTKEQMKMFLTRMGEGSKLIITGDPSQTDIPLKITSGLSHAASLLENIPDIGIIRFSSSEVLRHTLVQKIIDAYDKDKN